MSAGEAQSEVWLPLAHTVAQARGWDEVTRSLMLAGRQLAEMDNDLRTDSHAVAGCESAVWLALTGVGADAHFLAYSPSKIIRGVLAILLEKANQLPLADVKQTDFADYLNKLGLSRHLSQSRGNGIRHVIERMQSLARESGAAS